ncbi:MAG: hypothetical protein ABUT39_27720 [Acidobacteriota bacterium]
MTEYDALFQPARTAEDDLELVREHFHRASRPFLRSPWSWFGWSVFLPIGALATPLAFQIAGPAAVLFLWSVVILLGGAVEIVNVRRAGGGFGSGASTLASWVLSVQGNLSFVALALSALLVWGDMAWALPGLWLLLLGHSFYMLGGLAFPPFRTCGRIYQLGGLAALWPGGLPLLAFAAATFAGNLWMGISIWRERD